MKKLVSLSRLTDGASWRPKSACSLYGSYIISCRSFFFEMSLFVRESALADPGSLAQSSAIAININQKVGLPEV